MATAFLLLLLHGWVEPEVAAACDCATADPIEQMERADIAFEGVVIGTQLVPSAKLPEREYFDLSPPPDTEWTFLVRRTLKGDVPSAVLAGAVLTLGGRR